ncbi:MAG: CNNM domain-containing protein [Rickettsiales bacterium]|nr:CNNM domain-containing protein [Rickettsiales bacterium]
MILVSFLILFALLALSAFFSISETGITAASKAKIHTLKIEGSSRAKLLEKLLSKKDRLISTILLGNNFANSCASAFAAAFTIQLVGEDTESNAVIIVTILLTLAIIIFSEVLPKTYALMNAEKVALAVSPIIYFLTKILSPISVFIERAVSILMKLIGVKSHSMSQIVRGLDAIRGAVELHHSQGDVIKEDRDMLGGLLDLEHITVSEIMKHRKYIEAIDINLSNQEILKFVTESQFTRIPVYENDADNIIGIIHNKSFMKALHEQANGDITQLDVKSTLIPAWFIPDSTSLKEQLIAFRQKKSHFALVVDEYGTLLGHITLEDILEEIVGNIEDEHDKKFGKIEETPDGSYIVDGIMPIRDLNRELDLKLPVDEANTIAGIVINKAETIPSVGKAFNFYGYRFEIIKKRKNQLTKIKIQKIR